MVELSLRNLNQHCINKTGKLLRAFQRNICSIVRLLIYLFVYMHASSKFKSKTQPRIFLKKTKLNNCVKISRNRWFTSFTSTMIRALLKNKRCGFSSRLVNTNRHSRIHHAKKYTLRWVNKYISCPVFHVLFIHQYIFRLLVFRRYSLQY